MTVTTVSDQAADLTVVMHPGTSACGATVGNELSPWPDALAEGLVEDSVPVGTSTAQRRFRPRPGRWRVCAYVDTLTEYIGRGTTVFEVADRRAPEVEAYVSTGQAGRLVGLRYTAFDDSRISREQITIYRRGRRIAQVRTQLARRLLWVTAVARWRALRGLHGDLRFCVSATDAAGNRSAPACARIRIVA